MVETRSAHKTMTEQVQTYRRQRDSTWASCQESIIESDGWDVRPPADLPGEVEILTVQDSKAQALHFSKIMEDCSDEDFQAELAAKKKITLEAARAIRKLKLLLPIQATSTADPTPVARAATKAYLPKLNLATFSGDILTFNTFWESFAAVHLDEELSGHSKFRYLQGQLRDIPLQMMNGLL